MQKIVILAFWAMTVLGFSSAAQAQFPDIRLTLAQRSDESSNTEYQVSTRVFTFGTELVLVSPSGSRFDGRGGASMVVSTFEEIEGELFGLWTVEDAGTFGTDELQIHNFTVEPFELSDVFSESPFVVSPADGDTVQPGFLFDWAFAAGVDEPSSRTTSLSGFRGLDPSASFSVGSETTINAVFDPGVTSSPLTISAGSFETLDELVSSVTTLVDTPRSSFTGGLRFRNITSPITVTITSVPEPGSGAFFAVCGLSLFCGRKRSNA